MKNNPASIPSIALQPQYPYLLTPYFTHPHKRIRSNKPVQHPSYPLHCNHNIHIYLQAISPIHTNESGQTNQFSIHPIHCIATTISISTYRLFHPSTQTSQVKQTSSASILSIALQPQYPYLLTGYFTHPHKRVRSNKPVQHPSYPLHCNHNIHIYLPTISPIHTNESGQTSQFSIHHIRCIASTISISTYSLFHPSTQTSQVKQASSASITYPLHCNHNIHIYLPTISPIHTNESGQTSQFSIHHIRCIASTISISTYSLFHPSTQTSQVK